jgi:AraC-like DNA-binding protein
MSNAFVMNPLNPFFVSASKINLSASSAERKTTPHIHEYCEIYVNLSGNVSFVIEKNVYALRSGDIIFTKPYEYHHCVYHDDSDHLHYWIMFSADENPELFKILTDKKAGHGNHIRLSEEKKERFLTHCDRLAENSPEDHISTMAAFFKIVSCVCEGIEKFNVSNANTSLPKSLKDILDYVNKNLASIHTVNEIAEKFFISLSTLERLFKTHLSMTPKRYLEDKKLQSACLLLRQNASVTEACFESGFEDYSHFISIFKKRFDTTPLQYKKALAGEKTQSI